MSRSCERAAELFNDTSLWVNSSLSLAEMINDSPAATVSFIFLVLSLSHVAMGTICFMVVSSKHAAELKLRANIRVILLGMGVFTECASGLLPNIIGLNNIACWVYILAAYFLIPLMTAPMLVSLAIYYQRLLFAKLSQQFSTVENIGADLGVPQNSSLSMGNYFQKRTSKQALKERLEQETENPLLSRSETSSPEAQYSRAASDSTAAGTSDSAVGPRRASPNGTVASDNEPSQTEVNGQRETSNINGTANLTKDIDGGKSNVAASGEFKLNRTSALDLDGQKSVSGSSEGTFAQNFGRMLALKFFTSTLWEHVILILMLLPFVLAYVVRVTTTDYLKPSNGCTGCGLLTSIDVPVLLVAAIFAVGFGIWITHKLRSFDDRANLLHDVAKAFKYGATVALLGFIINTAAPVLSSNQFRIGWLRILGVNIMFFFFCVSPLWKLLLQELEIQRLRAIKRDIEATFRTVKRDRIRENIGRDRVSLLADVLSAEDHTLREKFKTELEREFAGEMLKFYDLAGEFEKNFYNRTESTRKALAKRIAKTYVVSNAPVQINIDASMREEIEEQLGLREHQNHTHAGGVLAVLSAMRRGRNTSAQTNRRSQQGEKGKEIEIEPSLFKEARLEMLQLMANGAFVRFLHFHFDEVMDLKQVKDRIERQEQQEGVSRTSSKRSLKDAHNNSPSDAEDDESSSVGGKSTLSSSTAAELPGNLPGSGTVSSNNKDKDDNGGNGDNGDNGDNDDKRIVPSAKDDRMATGTLTPSGSQEPDDSEFVTRYNGSN